MKNRNHFIGILFLILLSSCQPSSYKDSALYEAGVSEKLAEFRKTSYKDVHYELAFQLPESRNEAVKGEVILSFHLSGEIPVIIDFRADSAQIRELTVNNKSVPYTFENEHILIDRKDVREGPNAVFISFEASDQSLNRRDDYMYTLLVPDRARTLFPCFDQPNMKASYSLRLITPADWEAVANSPALNVIEDRGTNERLYSFGTSEPLSTYLFSFVAGKMQKEDYTRDNRTISIYHRETDPLKIAQCPDIADEVFDALEWMEEYTAVPYPFAKYDVIILPGFQYGGMEHTGATLYNDRRMFLNEQPTLNEQLSRSSLIAHETAHMWFGDYVTMEWFDDVWTKEIFANYFASRIVEPLYPDINHRLNFIRNYYLAAYSEDRTAGTNPIKQPLDNLSNAGLVYGQIIYNKSPIVLEMLVDKIGEEAFRKGIQEYLSTYAYSNATWEDLIQIWDNFTDEDLKSWSNAWVQEKGMPTVRLSVKDKQVIYRQEDLWERNLSWPQEFTSLLIDLKDLKDLKDFNTPKAPKTLKVSSANEQTPLEAMNFDNPVIIPNTDGKGYGFFCLTREQAEASFQLLHTHKDDVLKGSLLITLYENLLNKTIDPLQFRNELLKYVANEKNSLLYSIAIGYIANCQYYYNLPSEETEEGLWTIVSSNTNPAHRLQAFRTYRSVAKSKGAIDRLYMIWKEGKAPAGCALSENDYISLSYSLAVWLPEKAEEIGDIQRKRISNPDRLKEYNFIFPSVSPEKEVRDSVFSSLLQAENRSIEPWASSALANLNHSLRQKEAISYIRPSLDVLKEVQRTGDIFFPTNWLRALLAGHLSVDAKKEIDNFFPDNPDYHPMLTNKIKQQSDHLYRFAR